MEMIEHPDMWIALLQLMRELGNSGFLEHYNPKMLYHEFFVRFLDSRHILELSQHNPEAALSLVEFAQELGGRRFLGRHVEVFREETLSSNRFAELSERNPEAALAWFQLAREIGGKHFLDRLYKRRLHPEFFERMIRSHRLLELAERSPKIALACLNIIREFAEEGFLHPDFFARVLDQDYLIELSERDPNIALLWLQLVSDFANKCTMEHFMAKFISDEFFEQMFHHRRLCDMIERNPEATLSWIKVLLKLGGGRIIKDHCRDLIEEFFDISNLVQLLLDKPTAFAAVLQIARITRPSKAVEAIAECLTSQLRHSKVGQSVVETLPISALRDVEWLATESNNAELKAVISL